MAGEADIARAFTEIVADLEHMWGVNIHHIEAAMAEICNEIKERAKSYAPNAIVRDNIHYGVRRIQQGDEPVVAGYVGCSVERIPHSRVYVDNTWNAEVGRPIGLFWEVGFTLKYFGADTGITLKHPFLKPALNDVKGKLPSILEKHLKRAWRRAKTRKVTVEVNL